MRKVVLGAIGLSLLLTPWLISNAFLLLILQTAAISYIAALGLNLVLGFAGQVSIGHAALMGIGGYTTALLTTRLGVPFPLDLLAGGILAGIAGAMLGVPSLRLSGAYLAMATIGFNLIWQKMAINWVSFTGGADGIPGIPFPSFGPVTVDLRTNWYLVIATALVLLWTARNFTSSRYGRALLALKHDEAMAAAMGVNIFKAKLLTFSMSAVYAGFAGSLLARLNHHVSPSGFGLDTSLELTLIAVLAGPTSLTLPAVTSLFVTALPYLPELQELQDYRLIPYGAVLLAVVTLAPRGLQSLLSPVFNGFSRGSAEAPSARPAAFQIEGLAKRFGGIQALKGVDLCLKPGSLTALIGLNGSGKTTLVNLATGLDRPDRGKIYLDGRDITTTPVHRRAELGILRTFQTPRLIPELSVLDNVLLGYHATMVAPAWSIILGTRRALQEEGRARLLAQAAALEVGLTAEQLGRDISSLTQKDVRLLELARALAAQPSVLMLDEPTAGLNAQEARHVEHLLASLRNRGIAVLLVEHRLQMVMNIADHVVVLHEGRIIASGEAHKVRSQPEVLAAYLGSDID